MAPTGLLVRDSFHQVEQILVPKMLRQWVMYLGQDSITSGHPVITKIYEAIRWLFLLAFDVRRNRGIRYEIYFMRTDQKHKTPTPINHETLPRRIPA